MWSRLLLRAVPKLKPGALPHRLSLLPQGSSYGHFHRRLNVTLASVADKDEHFDKVLAKFHKDNTRLKLKGKKLDDALEQLETLYQLVPNELKPDLAVDAYDAKAYANKIALLRLLKKPWKTITQSDINALLDDLGFKTRVTSVDNYLSLFLSRYCCSCCSKSPEQIAQREFIEQHQEALRAVTSQRELENIYEVIIASQHLAAFEEAVSVLAFMVEGLVTEKTAEHLSRPCALWDIFPSELSPYKTSEAQISQVEEPVEDPTQSISPR